MKSVRIDYYAYFREKRGLSSEQIETSAGTLRELYYELAQTHGFKLPVANVKAIINDEFVPMDTEFCEGAAVVFVPPVAGG